MKNSKKSNLASLANHEIEKQKITILSEGQKSKIKGGACACCLCSPEVKGAGSYTATRSGHDLAISIAK